MNNDKPDKPDKLPLQERLRHGMESARQLMQPAAFRIAAPPASEPGVQESAIEADPSASKYGQLNMALKTLAAVATAIWRAKSKLDAEAEATLPDELRNLPRHIQAAWDALKAGQIQVDDPTGRQYVPGMAVNTLTIQPLDGITCEVIHETIKPSVYFNDALIQRADVILGRPADESEVTPTENEALQEPTSGDLDAPDKKGTSTDGPDND